MTISQAFRQFMIDSGFTETIYLKGVPIDAPDSCFWILAGGGSPILKNQTTGKVKNYVLFIYFRGSDSDVDEKLQELEQLVNSDSCTQLTDHDTIEMEATAFPTDEDIDSEERTVGLVQVTITVYDS